MLMTLTGIELDLQALNALLDECEGDLSRAPEAEAAVTKWMDELKDNQSAKLDAYLSVDRALESEIAVCKAQIDQYQQMKKSRENRREYLKGRIQQFMERTQQQKIQTDTLRRLWLQKSPDSMAFVGTNPGDLPSHLKRVTVEPARSAAMEEYKESGKVPEGFELKPGGLSLRVK